MGGRLVFPQLLTRSLLASQGLLYLGLQQKGPCGVRVLTTPGRLQDGLEDLLPGRGVALIGSPWLAVPPWSWLRLPLVKEEPREEAVPSVTCAYSHQAVAGGPAL